MIDRRHACGNRATTYIYLRTARQRGCPSRCSLSRKKPRDADRRHRPHRAAPNAIPTAETHFVNGRRSRAPIPRACRDGDVRPRLFLGRGAQVLGARRGVWVTAVGYAGGPTPNPTYEEVCSGRTGHNEVVLVVFDPKQVSYEKLLKVFWESHDPTQGMRQGNDVGTQYRSGIYVYRRRRSGRPPRRPRRSTQQALQGQAATAPITTEILDAPEFYFAEDYHQQYLAKNPHGYCGLGGTGVACQIGTGVAAR